MTAELLTPWPRRLVHTIAEWEALPPFEGFRLELVEGVLSYVVTPKSLHQRATTRTSDRMDDQLPAHLTSLAGVEVVLTEHPLTIRVPDVIVACTEPDGSDPARYLAADIRLAVEILSDGTRKVDRVLKFAEYAEAGIPRYWIIDIDGPVTLWSYVLVEGTYELAGEFTGTAVLEVDGHPVTLDLEALVRR